MVLELLVLAVPRLFADRWVDQEIHVVLTNYEE